MNNAQLREHYERAHPNLSNALYESRIPSSLPFMQMSTLPIEGMGRGMIPTMPQQPANVQPISVRGTGEMRNDNVISEIPMMKSVWLFVCLFEFKMFGKMERVEKCGSLKEGFCFVECINGYNH